MSIQNGIDDPDLHVIPNEGDIYEPGLTNGSGIDESNVKLSRKQIVIATTIISGNFLISVCFTILAAFFPQTALQKGATETQTGFIFSVFSISTMAFAPFVGFVIPKIGARFVFYCSVFVVAATSLLFAFVIDAPSGTPFVALSMTIRLVSGFGYICYKGATFSTIASQFPGKVATLMGINAGAFGVAVSLGPFIGGSLFDIGGFKLPFFSISALLFVMLVIMFFALKSVPNRNVQETTFSNAEVRSVCFSFIDVYLTPILYFPFSSVLVAEMANAYLDLAIANHVTETFGVSATVAGSLFIPFQIAYALTCPVVGFIVDKKHCDKGSMVFGLLLQSVAFILLGPAPFMHTKGSIWLTEISLILNAIGQAAAFIPGYKCIYEYVIKKGFPDDISTKSKVSGVFLLAMGSGQFIGPTIGGAIIQHYGYGWACCAIALLSIFPAILLTGLISHNKYQTIKANKEEYSKLLD